ncbi:MAG: hypothetical protein JWO20_1221 [Candidatus Angelobacter sp.]|nr:hypothetical protein [Candidatus Angelobacter sp.]
MLKRLRRPVWSLVYPFFVCASMAFSSLAEAQMTNAYGQASTAVTGTRYTLTGTVVNSVSGDPISRALVQVSTDRQRSVMTDQQGRFQIEDLPATRVMVQRVAKPGFFEQQQLSQRRRSPIDVGPNSAPLVLKLVPEAIIVGHVTDENREPMENVPVQMTTVAIQNGRKRWISGSVVRTNAEGEFRLANMQPGTYFVSAGPARSGTLEVYIPSPTEPGYPVTYYPGVSDLSAAGPFLLGGGQIAQADITMSPAPWFSISGVLTGYAEGYPPQLQFVNRAGNDAQMSMSFDPSSGKFEARVFAGQCFIKARAFDPPGKFLYADLPVTVNSKIEGIRVSVVSGGIPVVVQKQRTKPASAYATDPRAGGRAMSTDPAFEASMSIDANVQLISTDPAHRDARAGLQPGDNQLVIRDAENGRYIASITPTGAWYVQSVTHAGVDLLSQELAVVPGESRPIEIVLRDDFATLTATVQGWGDEADKFTQFVIVPERAPFTARLTASSGRSGEAGLGMYAPGDYRVYAFDRVDGLEYMNPEVLHAYDGYAARVSLLPDQKTSVSVQLIRRND